MDIVIGSFNCLNFGYSSRKKESEKHNYIANIILGECFDIVALQEIKCQYALDSILFALNFSNRAGEWKGSFDNEVNDYAFIWNSKKVDLAKTKLENGKERVFYPRIYNQYSKLEKYGRLPMYRNPYFARFHTVINGLPKVEIRLINTHIRYTKVATENQVTLGEKAIREYELRILSTCLYEILSNKNYGKEDGYGYAENSYTVLLGDYNLNLRQSGAGSPYINENLEKVSVKFGRDNGKLVVFQDEKTTIIKPDKHNNDTDDKRDIFVNNFDHFSYDEERFEGVGDKIEKIDSVRKYADDDIDKHYVAISDHVPIKLTLSINGRM